MMNKRIKKDQIKKEAHEGTLQYDDMNILQNVSRRRQLRCGTQSPTWEHNRNWWRGDQRRFFLRETHLFACYVAVWAILHVTRGVFYAFVCPRWHFISGTMIFKEHVFKNQFNGSNPLCVWNLYGTYLTLFTVDRSGVKYGQP